MLATTFGQSRGRLSVLPLHAEVKDTNTWDDPVESEGTREKVRRRTIRTRQTASSDY